LQELASEIIYWENAIEDPESLLNLINNSEVPWEDYLNYSDEITGQKKAFSSNTPGEIYDKLREIDKKFFKLYANEFSLDLNSFYVKDVDAFFDVKKMFKGYHISPHSDFYFNSDKSKKYPAYTMLLYLNDNYEGAKIGFPQFGISLKPKAGSFIIFPSRYMHEVAPHLVNGERIFYQTFVYYKEDLNAFI
jgi:Rps23 Pro-64 3,4-dihydroxylase Tpa1-like proline 4-hydroxylase